MKAATMQTSHTIEKVRQKEEKRKGKEKGNAQTHGVYGGSVILQMENKARGTQRETLVPGLPVDSCPESPSGLHGRQGP